MKMETIGDCEAKTHLSKLMDRVRQGEQFIIAKHGTRRFITLLSQLPIFVEQDEQLLAMKEFLSLARANGLSSYNASYLNLAMTRGIPLATLDKKLLAAARRVKVEILEG